MKLSDLMELAEKVLGRIADRLRNASNAEMAIFAFWTLFLHALRSYQMILHPQFWAEGGAIFYSQDYAQGWGAFFNIYAGYLHLWPRIVAFVVGFFPLMWGPSLYKFAVLFTHGVLCAIILSPRFPGDRLQKIIMMASTALVQQSGEVFMNLTNTNSLCAVILVATIASKPADRAEPRIAEGIILFITAMTGPFILFLWPILSLYSFLSDTFSGDKVRRIGALTLGFVIQLCFVNLHGRNVQTLSSSIIAWKSAFNNFFATLILADINVSSARTVFSILVCVGLFLLIYVERKAWRERILSLEALLIGCALTIHASALFINRGAPEKILPYGDGGRYFYAPYVLIFLATLSRPFQNRRWMLSRNGIVLLSLFLSLFYFETRMPFMDLRWPLQVEDFEHHGFRAFYILPPGWTMTLNEKQCWRCGSPTK